jgi:hypothetical protein
MTTVETSPDGKYFVPGNNQVARTQIGDLSISTIWWPGAGGGHFETLVFKGGEALTDSPEVTVGEADALRRHAEIVTEVAS